MDGSNRRVGGRRWRLRLSGPLRLEDPDGRDVTPPGRKGRALVAYLALARDGRASRERLRGLLWTDRGEDQARSSLRQELAELGALHHGPEPCLGADRESVRLHLERIEIDLRALEAGHDLPLVRLVELWRGEPLEGLGELRCAFDGWLAGERARWRETALARIARHLASLAAAERELAARALLAIDPAHELAHLTLIEGALARGDASAARRRYESCREALARELDLEPSAATRALLEARLARPSGAARPGRTAPSPAGPLVLLLPLAAAGNGAPPPEARAAADTLARLLVPFRPLVVLLEPPEGGAAVTARPAAGHLLHVRSQGDAAAGRLDLELVEAPTGRLLWAGGLEPGAQGEAARELLVARRIVPALQAAEAARARHRPEADLLAHELVLLALPILHRFEADHHAEAGRLLRLALERDPGAACAHAWLAWWHLAGRAGLAAVDPDEALALAAGHAREATLLDPEDALALAACAQCAAAAGRLHAALAASDRALAHNPLLALAHGQRAILECRRGDPEAALARIARCRELSPADAGWPQLRSTEALARLLADRLEEAVETALDALASLPRACTCQTLVAALALLGREEEARRRLAELLALRPGLTLDAVAGHAPLLPHHRARLVEGLARAGLRRSGDQA